MGLAKRYRRDGRLPTPTADLLGTYSRLRLSHAIRATLARVLPPVGHLSPFAVQLTVLHPRRWRRWVGTESPRVSSHELTHLLAGDVVDALESAGLQPFLIETGSGGLHLGLPATDRREALRTLKRSLDDVGWHIEWRRGHRHPVGSLARMRSISSVLRAEQWKIFRVHVLGKTGHIGYDEGPTLSFWEDTGERYERLGHRGLNRFPSNTPRTIETVDGRDYPGLEAFPVTGSISQIEEPIDVVYTWVDGSDPSWAEEFTRWRDAEGLDPDGDSAVHPSRFVAFDDLRYSLRSIWQYSGWVRHIYLVTADQHPSWLVEDERLTVVSHKDVMPADALPTFNSHAIEACLHRIDTLSEHFIYMNDDFFIGRPISPLLYFTSNGLIKFHNSAALIPPGEAARADLAVDSGAKNGRELLRAKFGRSPRFKLHHGPYALRRSVIFDLEKEFPEEFGATVRHRFRSAGDLSIASNLTQHYAYCTARAVPGEIRTLYQNIENARLELTLDRLLLGRDIDSFCLNATEDDGPNSRTGAALVNGFLAEYFPVPSPWERTDTSES